MPTMYDEGPSPEDVARFSDETAYCPSCGAEVWDGAPKCPECGRWIEGETQARHPEVAAARRKLFTVIAIMTLLAFSGILVLLRII